MPVAEYIHKYNGINSILNTEGDTAASELLRCVEDTDAWGTLWRSLCHAPTIRAHRTAPWMANTQENAKWCNSDLATLAPETTS